MIIAAMENALEALENVTKDYVERRQYKHNKAIDALRTAIEQAEKQEAWKTSDTAYRPGGLPQDFIKHEVDSFDDWSEWVCPDPTQYFMKCCDCGLVHEMQFKVVKYSEGDKCEDFDDPYVQAVFRARRVTPPAAPVQEPLGYWNAVEGWVELPEEAHKPAQAKTIPKWPLKHQWVNGRGYVVWRDVFEGNMRCSLDDAIAAHTQSVFVDEADAKEYCTFKNTTLPAAQPAPNDFELMKCWVEKPDGTIDGIASMRLALSKYGAAQQEPMPDDLIATYEKGFKDGAARRQWVGLTDEEQIALAKDSDGKTRHWLVCHVEAKIKEKNHG